MTQAIERQLLVGAGQCCAPVNQVFELDELRPQGRGLLLIPHWLVDVADFSASLLFNTGCSPLLGLVLFAQKSGLRLP